MSRLPRNTAPYHDAEYAALLRQIRFSEYAAACARSGRLQLISAELLSTARMLVRASEELRQARPAAKRLHAACVADASRSEQGH